MILFWLGLAICAVRRCCGAGLTLVLLPVLEVPARLVRIFQEKPLFIVPRGQPVPRAPRTCRFPTADGLTLRGCYLPRRSAAPRRHPVRPGVRLQSLVVRAVLREPAGDAGYDVFAFESRSQGDSDAQPGYEPLQWVTDYEVRRHPGRPGLPQEPARRRPARRRLLRHQQGGQRRPAGRRRATPTSAAASPTASSPPTRRWCRTCASGSASTTARTTCTACCRPWYYGMIGLTGAAADRARTRLPLPAPGKGLAAPRRRGRC